MSERRLRAWENFKLHGSWGRHESLEEFQNSYDGGWFTGEIGLMGTELDISLKVNRKSRRLAVIFNSQQPDNGEVKLFTWTGVGEQLGCSRLHIADPTLNDSEEAILGGYASSHRGNFQPAIRSLIRIVKEKLEIEELLFLGSSAGGFPALLYSQSFDNSMALLLSPVLSLERYQAALPTRHLLQDLNGVDSYGELRLKYPDLILDWSDFHSEDPESLNRVCIVQSRNDEVFWKAQTRPYLKYLGFDFQTTPAVFQSGGLSTIFGEWKKGHHPPPASLTYAISEALAKMPEGSLGDFVLTPEMLEWE